MRNVMVIEDGVDVGTIADRSGDCECCSVRPAPHGRRICAECSQKLLDAASGDNEARWYLCQRLGQNVLMAQLRALEGFYREQAECHKEHLARMAAATRMPMAFDQLAR